MLYYFDETADQGFVDKSTSISEYGVLAGLAFPDRKKEEIEDKIGSVLAAHIQQDYKKLHCTALFKGDSNQELREALYQVLLETEEYLIIYEGQYSVGVWQNEEALHEAIEANKPEIPNHIKIIQFKDRTRLYITLLTGIIVKLEECAIIENESHVHMVSDWIDEKVQKESLNLLADLQSKTKEVVARSFNLETKVRKEQRYQICCESEFSKITRVKDIAYLEEVTLISFAADFICFELLRHFRKKMKITNPIEFHSDDSLQGFRLKNKVAFSGDGYFSDLVYKPNVDGYQ